MQMWKDIKLVETCGACPEQYDAYLEGELVGYLRLRHGYFKAKHNGKIVYEAYPMGDGAFEHHERKKYLKKARKAIFKSITNDKI